MRHMIAGLTILAIACGGSAESAGDAADDKAPTTTPAEVGAATVHEIQMELVDGSYRYTPSTLAIKTGDTVRWINASGGPHNVAFYGDQVPEGADVVLNASMANRIANLAGELLIAPNAVYEVSFEGAPAGDYAYYCTPHEALGMNASLTVEE